MSVQNASVRSSERQSVVTAQAGGFSTSTNYHVTVASGPDAGKGVSLGDSTPTLLIGQGPACELRLMDPRASRRHASLRIDRKRLRLVDLDSTNGTFVNDVRVNDAWLAGGESVRIGETQLAITTGGAGDAPSKLDRFGSVIGASSAMRRIYPLCERLAASNVTVVIEGETGTGKEVLAESLHEVGPRRDHPIVVFDCTTVAPSLVESALFGHEKGAFTGATNAHRGVFEQAHRGTLLIDEIGDLELSLQAKLLRVLQRGEVVRVGSERVQAVDVRIMAATRRDLDKEVHAGRFRDDLYYRLAIARIELPPLRDREGDIALLARHFWSQVGGAPRGLEHGALARLEAASWPGNVRELYNAVARLAALGELGHLGLREATTPSAAGADMRSVVSSGLSYAAARERVLESFERTYVEHMLLTHGGNVTRAAEASGLGRRYFRLLKSKSNKQSP